MSTDCLTTIDHEHPGNNNIYVTCDASKIGTGAVLSFSPTWESAQSITFCSKLLKDAELHYPTHEKEMLAIVHALCKWQPDLVSTPFFIYTDYRMLKYFNTQQDLSARQLRWKEFLSEYEGHIVYIHGRNNTATDTLSHVTYVKGLVSANAHAASVSDTGSNTQ